VLLRKLLGRIVRIDGIVAIIMPSAAPWPPRSSRTSSSAASQEAGVSAASLLEHVSAVREVAGMLAGFSSQCHLERKRIARLGGHRSLEDGPTI
jgi:hypothetical protein